MILIQIGILDPVPEPSDFPEASFGCLETGRGHLPLEAMDVDGEISGLLARVRLEQTFVNVFRDSLEATYIFPLPARHGVTRFRMRIGERVVDGVLRERGEARREYEQALRDGHRAAIAEEDRPEIFTMRVGNIPAGERVSVELEMSGPVAFSDGEATFRFPLVVAPKYIPGVAIDGPSVGSGTASDTSHVRDASRISPPVRLPGMPGPVRLGIGLTLEPSGLEPVDLRSSLHEVRARDEGGGRLRLWIEPGERLDRDFILRWKLGGTGVRTGMTVHREEGHEEGTFAVTLVPPALGEMGIQPREVVVLLDRSGSMEGWKMAAACRAAGRLVDSLTAHDRFALIAFDNSPRDLFSADGVARMVPASDRNRFQAMQALGKVKAHGGTELAAALECAVNLHNMVGKIEGRQRVVILVTDGQIGNESQVLAWMDRTGQDIRVFSVGIDRAVNASFLERLSSGSGGTFELVESEDRLDEVMQQVSRRVGNPVLTGVTLDAGPGMTVVGESITPAGAIDVFPGVPAVIRGRFRGVPTGPVTVRAFSPAGELHSFPVTSVTSSNPAIRVAWARSRLLDLEHRYVAGGGKDRAFAKQIVDFSLEHGVMCRFTSFVAVDRSEVVSPGGPGHRLTQPVEPASGWEMLKREAPAPQKKSLSSSRARESVPRMQMSPSASRAPAPSIPESSSKDVENLMLDCLGERAFAAEELGGMEPFAAESLAAPSARPPPGARGKAEPPRSPPPPVVIPDWSDAQVVARCLSWDVAFVLRGLLGWPTPPVADQGGGALVALGGDGQWLERAARAPVRDPSDPVLRQELRDFAAAVIRLCDGLSPRGPELAKRLYPIAAILRELLDALQPAVPPARAVIDVVERFDTIGNLSWRKLPTTPLPKQDQEFWM